MSEDIVARLMRLAEALGVATEAAKSIVRYQQTMEDDAWVRGKILETAAAEQSAREALRTELQTLHTAYSHSQQEFLDASKDAERYRWLRNQPPTYSDGHPRNYAWNGVAYTMYYDEVNERLGEELDAAIDAALNKAAG